MGSPISFSGFNNIDFGTILNLIMQQERAPVVALETQKTALKTQNSIFATFASKLSALESAAQNVAKAGSLARLSATSSDASALGVSTGSGTVEGTYEVVVSDLARAQVLTSQTTYAALDDIVATSGTVSLALSGEPPVDIPVTGPMTLAQLASAINAESEAPVTAAVVQVSPGNFKLVLTGKNTGLANAFTVQMSAPLAGGAGLAFLDTDGDALYGDSPADNAQAASDAQLTVNNIPVSSSSNVVEAVIPGVTLTLSGKDAAKTVTVKVTQDRDEATALVEKFIGAYNDVVAFLKDQQTAAIGGKASISRDPLLRGLHDSVRRVLLDSYGAGTFTRLPSVGVGFDRTGKMTLDKGVFKEALTASQEDVQALFGGVDGSGGAFGALTDVVGEYTQSGGLVASLRERLDTQVAKLDQRLATLESQLALRRLALQQEFVAADRAMSQLNSQGTSLAQLSNQYRLF